MIAKLRQLVRSPASRRNQLRRRVWPLARRLIADVPAIGVESGGTLIFAHADDKCITYALLARGEWQRAEVLRASELLKPNGREGGVLVNVGANIGTTAIYAMQTGLFRTAVAIEPDPQNARLLRANLAANGLGHCTVIEAAASSSPGTLPFEISPANRGENRIVQPGLTDPRNSRISVPAMRLDDALASAGVTPSDIALLWIDVEGHEFDVLGGATHILAAGVPLVLEIWPRGLRSTGTLHPLMDLLAANYEHYVDLGAAEPTTAKMSKLLEMTERAQDWSTAFDILLPGRNTAAQAAAL